MDGVVTHACLQVVALLVENVQAYRSCVSTAMMSVCLAARAVGRATFGRACLAVRGPCQKITSRPRARVNTNIDRASRPRSSTRSIAAPLTRTNRDPFHNVGARWPTLCGVAGTASPYAATPRGL